MDAYPRYSLVQQLVHWAAAAIIIGLLASGQILDNLGFDGLKARYGIETTNLIYKYHKTFGVILLGLMTLRLVLRLTLGKPAYDPPLPRLNKVASEVVHGLLYLALLAQPMLGWAATAAGGYPVEFFDTTLPRFLAKDPALAETLFGLHGAVGSLIMLLAALHIGAALMHWLVRRDGVMRRMGLG